MYIHKKSLSEIDVQRKKMESLIHFWEKEGVPLPDFFHQMMDFEKPILFRARHVASGKNEDYRFSEFAHENNMIPVWNEYLEDTFVSVSRPKLNLLHPRNLSNQRIKLTNPHHWEKKKISEIHAAGGKKIVAFHNDLWEKIPGEKYKYDFSSWLQKFGTAKDYYFADLTLFTAFGVLSADFHGNENPLSSKGAGKFTETIVEPAFKEVENVFGIQPKIVQFPYQTGDELYRNL